MQAGQDAWRVGPGFIDLKHLVLLGVKIVSLGSVQPVFGVFPH